MKTALVTGASRGIGRAIAVDLGRDHHVLVGGRDAAAVAEVVALLPSAEPFLAELRDEAAVTTAVAGLEHLDVLVHSAGIVRLGTVAESSTADWTEQLAVNLVAPATLTRALLPALRAARGLVVFINSGAGLTAFPGWSGYAASKFGVRALADALRAEERNTLRVTSIHPGRVDTDMQRAIIAAEGRDYHREHFLTPAAVAATVRLAVDAPANTQVESLSIRPT